MTGPRPSWLAHVDADTARVASFEVELSARAALSPQRACLSPAAGVERLPVEQPACVEWMADGRPQHVRILLRDLPAWTGVVTHLRFDPVAAGAAPIGTQVWTRDPRLSAAPAPAASSAGTR